MKRIVFHISWDNGIRRWIAKIERDPEIVGIGEWDFPVSGAAMTKEKFISECAEVCRGIQNRMHGLAQIIVHRKKDGQFETEYTYGDDPVESKG